MTLNSISGGYFIVSPFTFLPPSEAADWANITIHAMTDEGFVQATIYASFDRSTKRKNPIYSTIVDPHIENIAKYSQIPSMILQKIQVAV